MNISATGPTSSELDPLLAQLDQLQRALAEHQRQLMHLSGDQARAAALRNSGLIVRQINALHAEVEGLNRALRAQAGEQERMRALQDVGAVLNSSLDVDVVLQQVMDAIIRLTNAERAMLMLYNDQGDLEVRVARNFSQETLADADALDISHSIARQVAATGEAIVTLNAQEDERFSAQHSIVSYKLRSILCAPLRIKGAITGVIYADNRIASGIFGDDERVLLSAFADQAAVAIENARLFHEVAHMKRLMDDVFASIAGGVVTIDDSGRVALMNRAAENILGAPAEHAMMRDYRIALPLPVNLIEPLVRSASVDGLTQRLEFDLQTSPGHASASVALTVSPVRSVANEPARGVVLVIDDVSEKKRIESLRRYLPSALVDRVRDLDAAQRPQRRRITVLFADIRDFSRYGEYLDPERLIELANGFLSEAVAAISEHHGLIDKFTGDAVMALFNTPLNPQPDHVEQAIRTALRLRSRLEAQRSGLAADSVIHFGIGIHTGEAVVGNLGSSQRKDYSAVGDVVNLCKRLQELAGHDEILISRSVFDLIIDGARVSPLPPVQVKGRQTLEEVFRLEGWDSANGSTSG